MMLENLQMFTPRLNIWVAWQATGHVSMYLLFSLQDVTPRIMPDSSLATKENKLHHQGQITKKVTRLFVSPPVSPVSSPLH